MSKNLKSICILANGYPTEDDPGYAFIKPLVCSFADNGLECTVIAPQSISRIFQGKKKKRPEVWTDISGNGNKVKIIQPKYLSFSSLHILGFRPSVYFRDKAVRRAFKAYKVSTDVLYGHFWEYGISASKLAASLKEYTPVIVATGESSIWIDNRYTPKEIERFLPYIKGVVCVSSKNLKESEQLGLLRFAPKIVVAPNAVNPKEFYQINRAEARKKLEIDCNENIGVFVGEFCERKGILRVVEAARAQPDIKLICIGKGTQNPESDQIIFKGPVPHNQLVWYLNAANFFVLPTLAEGCCNAVIEALSCGIPIISSNLDFNLDVLNENNAILVNPSNVNEISKAISSLLDNDDLVTSLSKNALESAKQLTIDSRADKILQFIKDSVC